MTIRCKDYEYDCQQIGIGLDTGGNVLCDMAEGLFSYHGNNCDIELQFHDDDCKDLIFRIGGEHYTALQIVQWCEANHDEIRRETLAEDDGPAVYLQSEFI